MAEITRFAPSPTGLLHLGHAYSAWVGWQAARDGGGRFSVRIEDIDGPRCRPEYEAAIFEDLAWLGLDWHPEVWRQSDRIPAYTQAVERLRGQGLLYPCFCSRTSIRRELAAMANAPHGPEGPLYPGRCRGLSAAERSDRIAAGEAHAWRLDTGAATARVGRLTWWDRRAGEQSADPASLGDVMLVGKDRPAAYHLSVVVDDAAQEITLVTRGRDLFHATHIHRLLQALLDLPVPRYHHHRLVRDDAGTRLAKRADAFALRRYREQGLAPADVWARAGVAPPAPGRPAFRSA